MAHDQKVYQARDLILGHIAEHEAADHAGQVCWNERANVIAYFCHCLGVRGPAAMAKVAAELSCYDERCETPGCDHRPTPVSLPGTEGAGHG